MRRGLEHPINPNAVIIITTAGYVLKRYRHDFDGLSRFNYLILDEVHERTIDYDLILLFLKRRMISTSTSSQFPMRILLMSATPNRELYQRYFQDVCPVGEVESKCYLLIYS